MKKNIKESLKLLNEDDITGTILYLIYKLSNEPKYSTLSQLVYILDKESLFKLCSIFGECEIKIPTVDELRMYTGALYIYYAIKYDHISFDKAFNSLKMDNINRKAIYDLYKSFTGILDE